MTIIDANIILRYLLNDHPVMSQDAKMVILSGAQITAEVLAEVVYVLKDVYAIDRQTIANIVGTFLQEVTISHKPSIEYACILFGCSSLDFVDCILAGYHYMNHDRVITCDKKLQKVLDKKTDI